MDETNGREDGLCVHRHSFKIDQFVVLAISVDNVLLCTPILDSLIVLAIVAILCFEALFLQWIYFNQNYLIYKLPNAASNFDCHI